LDLKYLVNLLDEYELDFYDVMDSVRCNFGADGKLEFNTIIYEVLDSIAHKFLEEQTENLTDEKAEFEIYTNYMDSHIYFTDDEVQSKFEGYF
jgi:transcriptional/translational regulatory protein YebC/TACO1